MQRPETLQVKLYHLTQYWQGTSVSVATKSGLAIALRQHVMDHGCPTQLKGFLVHVWVVLIVSLDAVIQNECEMAWDKLMQHD